MRLPRPNDTIRQITRLAGRHVLIGMFGLVGLFSLAACAGSSSGNPPQGATVTLAMTDSPSDAFQAVTVTVASAALIGEDGPIDIPFPDGAPITVDLLDLDGINQILATATIPAGTYIKIRLQVTDATVTFADGTTQSVDLVANGKVDLNFRGPVILSAGETTTIQLDFSAADSIKFRTTGSGKLILRPQIFVSTTPTSNDGTTPPIDDLAGVIASRDDTQQTLMLNVHRLLQVTVVATDTTTILGEDGTPIAFGDLNAGTFVHVEGTLDAKGRVVASLVQVDIERKITRGEITQLDPTQGTFTLLHADHATTPVTFDDATKVRFLGKALTRDDLTNGQIVYVRGTPDTTDPQTVHATVIRIRPDRFRGTVADVSQCDTNGLLPLVVTPERLLARLSLAGITLSPTNTIVLEFPPGFSCSASGIVDGLEIRVLGHLVPHTPDATDPNPVRFLVLNRAAFPRLNITGAVFVLPQRTVTGTVTSVTPDQNGALLGTLVLTTTDSGGLFCDLSGRLLGGQVTVVVTSSTVFDNGLSFTQDLVNHHVSVVGTFTLSRLLGINLAATEVQLASSS